MRVRFWGTRGSLPKPGPETLRFGGNTSCVEVWSSNGTLIILDCGSGLHGLGHRLREQGVDGGHILISHTHWDHIQGIPFFAPFFVPGQRWHIYAPRGFGQPLQETLAGQMQYAYFPVRFDQMAADICFHELTEGTFEIGDIRIEARYMNHTALTLGFRLEANGVSMVYATDHEPFVRQLASGEGEIVGRDRQHCAFLEDADLLIHDAQFTALEYPERAGWGHSTVEYAVTVAKAARVRRLALTHHDPMRGDAEIDRLVSDARHRFALQEGPVDIFAAAEGQTVELIRRGIEAPERRKNVSTFAKPAALLKPSMVLAPLELSYSEIIREAARCDGIEVIHAENAAIAKAIAMSAMPSVAVLDVKSIGANGERSCNTQHGARTLRDVPLIYVGEGVATGTVAKDDEAIDFLIAPFSLAYARTVIRASLLRAIRRWQLAPLPEDEEDRLRVLNGLSILDTPHEDRFDRITRLAASLFDVPMALISLVDRDRQWFKSCHGLDASETSRETSFCAHAIVAGTPLIVPDTFLDTRFAENPLVVGAPHIRFYAGVPVVACGKCIGTVCVLDSRPHFLNEAEIGLLQDLAVLTEAEIRRTT